MLEILHLFTHMLNHCFPRDQFFLTAFPPPLLFFDYMKVRMRGQGIKDTVHM